jgi:AraC family transcriptional regulator
MSVQLSAGAFHGRTLRARRTQYLQASENRYAPQQQLPIHAHNGAFLTLTVGGGYHEYIGQTARCARSMHVAWHPPGEEHAVAVHADGALCLNIELSDELYAHGVDLSPRLAQPAEPCAEAIQFARRLYSELAASDAAGALAMDGLMLELLAVLARMPETRRTQPAQWLKRARARIADLAASPISMRDLAMESGVHPVHLTRAFRHAYGVSPAQFARELRIERACRLLADPALALAEVATRAGFSDQSHMTRVLRARLGFTPGARRRMPRPRTG